MHTCPRDVSHSRAAWLAHSRSSLSSLTHSSNVVPWRPECWEGGRQPSLGASVPLPSIQYLIWMRRTGGTSTSPGPEANGDSCSAAPLLPRLALGPLWPRPIVADSAILPSVILSRAPRPISACWTDRTTFIAGAGQADRVAASQPPAIYQVPYNYFDT